MVQSDGVLPPAGAFPLLRPAATLDELIPRIGDPLAFMTRVEVNVARDIVVVSGSMVEGLGNTASDIDLFVIDWTDEPAQRAVRCSTTRTAAGSTWSTSTETRSWACTSA